MEGGGEVARVHHSQDVSHLQILPGGVEWKVNLTSNLNILTFRDRKLISKEKYLDEFQCSICETVEVS